MLGRLLQTLLHMFTMVVCVHMLLSFTSEREVYIAVGEMILLVSLHFACCQNSMLKVDDLQGLGQ